MSKKVHLFTLASVVASAIIHNIHSYSALGSRLSALGSRSGAALRKSPLIYGLPIESDGGGGGGGDCSARAPCDSIIDANEGARHGGGFAAFVRSLVTRMPARRSSTPTLNFCPRGKTSTRPLFGGNLITPFIHRP